MSLSQDPDWIKAQEELKGSMQKEIGLMREMLSSLLQEESFLLSHNQEEWTSLMQKRSILIEKLKAFREDRDLATKVLTDLSLQEETIKTPGFEDILSDSGESCEIILLLDQLMALTYKINQQNTRNQMLSDQVQQWQGTLDGSPYVLLPHPEVSFKKPVLMTMQDPAEGTELG